MNEPAVSHYIRGILTHVTAWFLVSWLLPFIFLGFTRESASKLGFVLPIFLIGLIPLLIGSAVWMLPFFFPAVVERFLFLYHFWVALGASIALLIYVDMQFAGDPIPPRPVYSAPAVCAFFVALCVSYVFTRALKPRNA